MIQYIYFVKCPECADEPFDFFDEAKDYALGCLSKKPIITQIEVNRNDFGECTDSADLGTIWSWEDMMTETEAEPTISIFTKDDLKRMAGGQDPEFDNIDNSVDFEVEEPETSEVAASDKTPDNFRKPIPEGMTIEQLVEEMEENEDTVECTWCNDLFDKSECRKEVNLGWLCSRCEAAIKSRGETLTFRENNYWDSLDETLDKTSEISESLTWTCYFDNKEIGTVTAATEAEALEKMQVEYPEYSYSESDGCFGVSLLEESKAPKSVLEELEDADVYRERLSLCPECGENTFDHDTGLCLNCGFNTLD